MTDRSPITKQRSEWTPLDTENARLVVDYLTAQGATEVAVWRRPVTDGDLTAVVGHEPAGWHMSISHARPERKRGMALAPRYPTWDEIAGARYGLLPDDLTMVMHLPPPSDYVAIHDTTFHLHEQRTNHAQQ